MSCLWQEIYKNKSVSPVHSMRAMGSQELHWNVRRNLQLHQHAIQADWHGILGLQAMHGIRARNEPQSETARRGDGGDKKCL